MKDVDGTYFKPAKVTIYVSCTEESTLDSEGEITDRPIINDVTVETKVNTPVTIDVLGNDDHIPPGECGLFN